MGTPPGGCRDVKCAFVTAFEVNPWMGTFSFALPPALLPFHSRTASSSTTLKYIRSRDHSRGERMPDWGKWFRRLKKHKIRTPPTTPTLTSDLSTTVGNGLNVALRLLQEAVTGIGVPGLEATVNGVVGVIDLIKDVRDNAIDLSDLIDRISSLANTISMAPNLHPGVDEVPESLLSRVDVFLSELHGMLKEVQQMLLDKNPVIRAANSHGHKEAIEDINTRITRLLNQFTAQGVLSLELDMAGARRDIRSMDKAQKALVVTQEHLLVAQEDLVVTQNAQLYENLIHAIPRVHARYNDTSTKPSRPCHPGTRLALLQTIRQWIDDESSETPYFWLCGEVGVGKSTVAHTIAQEQDALKRLGASFFFSRHDDSRRSPYLLFTSIAYQLARFDEGIYKALAEALKPDPDIVKRTPLEQFKRLVLEPLVQSGIDPSRTVVIVIDGLDECLDPATVLDVLAQGIGKVAVRLRVLISSRPYADIVSKFKGRQLYYLTSETQFRNIDPQTLSDDIAAYLSWSLGALALQSGLPSPWPPQEQLDELIRRAAGLFIIASTYAKYIENPAVGNPVDQLARILSRRKRLGSSPLAELDDLYDQVLNDLRSRIPLDVGTARDVLTILIHGQGPINVHILAGLLSIDPSDVRLILRHLTAVIPLPENDGDAIVPFHASFGEYFRDRMRCTVQELFIDTEAAFGRIAIQCSDAITSVVTDGIIVGEYDSARGYPWTPDHLRHVVVNLEHYLSHSPPAPLEEAKKNIVGAGIWEVFSLIMSGDWLALHIINLIDAAGGFEDLPHIEGSSKDERSRSLGILMVVDSISSIKRVSEKAATARSEITAEVSYIRRRQAFKFVKFIRESIWDEFFGILRILRNVRCWMRYTHNNVMSFKGIDVKFDKNDVPQEMLVFIASPLDIRRSSSLLDYLERKDDLDVTSRLRIALSIADGLRYLHESSPPQPYNGVTPHQIMVSEEGQPVLYPSTWNVDWPSRLSSNAQDDVDEIASLWDSDWWARGWDHWNPAGGREWEGSVEKRLQVDIWDFGSIIYRMIAGEEPLITYGRLVGDNKALPWDKSYYEVAVPLLLNALQATEEVKELLKSCWIVRRQDRPRMGEVFERLKAIVEAMKT